METQNEKNVERESSSVIGLKRKMMKGGFE